MENILVNEIQLKSLHVNVLELTMTCKTDQIIANLEVNYNYDGEIKFISVNIKVNQPDDKTLFVIKSTYQFTVNQRMSEDKLTELVIESLKPRIEEIIALITLEVGFVNVN